MRSCTSAVFAVAICLLAVRAATVRAEDWPTYQHDNRRSGVTSEKLRLPLQKAWEYVGADPPQTAWAGPAKWDSYANIRNLKSMRNFDPVFYATVAQGCVFFGSSADDAVHCLDLRTGTERWAYCTDGPIRLPPSFHNGKLYFGSDDGCVYCIRSDSGERVWRYEAPPEAGKIPFNGKLISLSPCRTGVLVQDGKAYFAASLLPWDKSYLCALDAESGSIEGTGLYKREHEHMTAQGPMIASPTRLYISQGRQTPLIFDCAGGDIVQSLGSSGFGGVFGLLTEDSMFVHGHGQNHRAEGELRFFGSEKKDLLVTFPHATAIVIRAGIVYLHADGQLQAFDRDKYVAVQGGIDRLEKRRKELQDRKKKLPAGATDADRRQLDDEFRSAGQQIAELQRSLPSCFLWRVPSDCPLTLILAGDTLLAGGEDKIAAYEIAAGRECWTASVEGPAYGLAVADGSLLVSTDLGRVVCFAGVQEQLLQYRFPFERVDPLVDLLKPAMKFATDYFVGCDVSPCVFEMYWRLRGMEKTLTEILLNPRLTQEMMRRCTEFSIALSEAACRRFDLDWLWLGDDAGGQQSMLMNPRTWREMVKPLLKQNADVGKRHGIYVAFHSCGAIRPIIDDLIEIGIDVLNPIQCNCPGMNPLELKREFGRELAFMGGVDTQGVLPHGTADQVRRATAELLEGMSADGGGYILAASHTVPPETPDENIFAMYDEAGITTEEIFDKAAGIRESLRRQHP